MESDQKIGGRVKTSISKHIKGLIKKHFSKFGQGYLEQHFLSHYKSVRKKYEELDVVNAIHEYKVPLTTFSSASKNLPIAQPTGIAKALAGLAKAGLAGVQAHDLAKLLPPNPMEPVLNIMADIRAYFVTTIAYKQFMDNVPLTIDLDLVCGIKQDVLVVLYTSLGINGQDGHQICKELVQESPQVADKRADLQKKLERLEVASRELLLLGV
ncbi:hypothetical protein CVT25_012429 [Psilocybe cyanescens]|uniref:GED domain-containing protein n=1 Tax=Psilocybe cyanescens TaxID=93625 RepID=A0A409XUX1_PSICY|nr:hypothetical protein CVT25_012429 [Psilocybe cyanescens]